MAIINSQVPQGAPQGPPQGGQVPPQMPEQEGEQSDVNEQGEEASQEEQDWYNRAMIVVGRALYEKNAIKDLVAAIKGSNDPADALADATLRVVQAVDDKLQGNIPESMLASIATDTMGQIVEGLQAAGMKIDGQLISQATQGMMTKFLKEQGVPPEEIQKMTQSVDMNQMAGQVNGALQEAS